MKRSQIHNIRNIMCLLAFFLVMTLFIFRTFFIPITIQGHSMSPGIKHQSKGFSNLLPIKIGRIKKRDLVIIRMDDYDEIMIIKRVVGLPGDVVESANDVLFINGIPVKENYLNTEHLNYYHEIKQLFTKPFGPIKLEKSEYFVLGDNRPISFDSREFGPVHKNQIISSGWYRSAFD